VEDAVDSIGALTDARMQEAATAQLASEICRDSPRLIHRDDSTRDVPRLGEHGGRHPRGKRLLYRSAAADRPARGGCGGQ